MAPKYLLAIDEGTTSTRAIIFDHDGQKVTESQKEFRQYFPNPGWVEHDANEIWATQLSVAVEAMQKVGASCSTQPGLGYICSNSF